MAQPVSQSRTMWVKKGTVVNGKKVKKGYVAQYGKPERRVTNRVRLEVDTPKRGKAGDVVRLRKGRYVTKKKKDQATAGGGVTKAQAAAARRNASSSAAASKPSKPKRPKGWKTASRIGGYTPGTRLAGSGSDGVNAATSSGSARTSDYVHDAFSSYWQQPASGSKRYSRPATQNRPTPGARMQLRTDKSGRKRWVKVV